IFTTISSPPTKSAPASCASFTFSPVAITSTRFDLPSPFGSTTVPRTIWSDCFGSTRSLIESSTVSSNLTKCAFFKTSAASPSLYARASTSLRAFSIFFPPALPIAFSCASFSAVRCLLSFYFDAHIARRAHHGADRGLQIRRIQIDQLDLRDVFHLLARHLRHFRAIRLGRTFHDSRGALQQFGRRRSLGYERERAVAINRHQHGNDHSVRLFVGFRVELLAKIHNVDALRAQRRAHGRRRRGFRRR